MKHTKYIQIVLIGILAFGTQFSAFAQEGIHFFQGNWAQLQAESKKQNKPVMVDCYASWCGPCKKMARYIFPIKEVAEYYNNNFLCYSIDMEKGEGKDVAKTYKIGSYPTFIYLNPEGELIHRTVGGRPANIFIADGKTALDPQKSLYGMLKRFKSGERDSTFLLDLVQMTSDVDEKVQEEALGAYWKTVPQSELTSAKNWMLFKNYERDISSSQYQYVLANRDVFAGKTSKADVDNTLYAVAGYNMQKAAENQNEKQLKQAKAILAGSDNMDLIKFGAFSEVMYYKGAKNWKEFRKLAQEYVDKYADNKPEVYNNVAFEAATGTDDKQCLKDAEKWAKQSIAISKLPYNMETYALVQYKQGKYKEAEATANEALTLARNANADTTSIDELLVRIKKGE